MRYDNTLPRGINHKFFSTSQNQRQIPDMFFLRAFPAGADLLVHHISAGMPPMSP